MKYLPLFADVRGKRCLVVGGGDVAYRKINFLLEAGAQVCVVAPQISLRVAELTERVEIHNHAFQQSDLQNCFLVIAATNRPDVNAQVSEYAQKMNLLVNVVDNSPLCNFIVPSVVDRSPVQIAISTGGASPVLARLLRSKLETEIPAAYGRLGAFCEQYRQAVKDQLPEVDRRRRFWEDIMQGEVAELVFSGQEQVAGAKLEMLLKGLDLEQALPGEVYLVGAGPGDPDLLTFRALRLMQKADIVVYDRLVTPEILALCRRDAELIYVGKERNHHTLPQEDINHLLVRLAKEGKRVCRLKGGDPFIFGRGGEEIDTLAEEGISFQVVPAITAASGVAAYAGIPLTHRDYAQAVVFTTGHLKDGSTNINWNALAHPQQTVVFYMGLHGVDIICKELIAHGMSTATPIAMVQQGTTKNQKVITGTLETMPEKVRNAHLQAPTLIIVGEVVRLHEKLRWFNP